MHNQAGATLYGVQTLSTNAWPQLIRVLCSAIRSKTVTEKTAAWPWSKTRKTVATASRIEIKKHVA